MDFLKQANKYDLILSGGGFRATLFHLGAVIRLNELGFLPKLKLVTSVSGGSILAAFLGMKWNKLEFENDTCINFSDAVMLPIMEFCSQSIDIRTILKGLFTPWKLRSLGNLLEKAYRKKLFGEATLQDLPEFPYFEILSTDLINLRTFTFSREYAGVFFEEAVLNPIIRLSECVAASSAFPPVFSPYKLILSRSLNKVVYMENNQHVYETDYNCTHDYPPFHEKAMDWLTGNYREKDSRHCIYYLSDAGVISNIGMELGNEYSSSEHVFLSDAGAILQPINPTWLGTNWFNLTLRAAMLSSSQGDPLRIHQFKSFNESNERIYWSISTNINCHEYSQVPNRIVCKNSVTKSLARIRTRLNSFTKEEQCQLINWGYSICDTRLRQSLVDYRHLAPQTIPFPEYDLNK